jgi:hypothetical protein
MPNIDKQQMIEAMERNQMITGLLLEKKWTTEEIMNAVKQAFPQWWNDRRNKGFDAVKTRTLCLNDVQRIYQKAKRDGLDVEFKRVENLKIRDNPLSPEKITSWFRDINNVQKLSWNQRSEIQLALGL